ncbi:MAG: polysaccharide deacetylase [Candidatus Rokuibacteriota bacterium]|nr:MAG: polysaccharide deacetylase [Candidatus Rokubacteria bacterium]
MIGALLLGLLQALAPPVAAETLVPNELGRVMILEYHKVDQPEDRWTRTPANFRRDLETLYAKGYRLVGLNDLVDGRIALPAGTTPVVLTFDDSSPGQFRYLERGGEPTIDPNCAVGILEAFAARYPDFGRTATFFVLPGASRPNRLFNQPEYEKRKLQYLVAHGFEIGNHTLWHANLGKYSEAVVRTQIAQAQEWIGRYVPGYRIRTIALPHGVYPREVEWALRGTANGTTYQYDAILKVSGGPTASPFSSAFDTAGLPRIQALERELAYWLAYFDRTPGDRFVSDGDASAVAIPRGSRPRLRPELPSGLKVVERD